MLDFSFKGAESGATFRVSDQEPESWFPARQCRDFVAQFRFDRNRMGMRASVLRWRLMRLFRNLFAPAQISRGFPEPRL
jgi:hypothetical protein